MHEEADSATYLPTLCNGYGDWIDVTDSAQCLPGGEIPPTLAVRHINVLDESIHEASTLTFVVGTTLSPARRVGQSIEFSDGVCSGVVSKAREACKVIGDGVRIGSHDHK